MDGTTRHGRRGALAIVAAQLVLAAALTLPGVAVAAASVNLDQWASLDNAWQNGNLNGNNSRYPEGGIVPFRLAIEGLSAGPHEVTIEYDFTAGGHKAYDFLATWNYTHAAGKICIPSGGAISSMCPSMPASSSFPFPTDFYIADGLSVAAAQAYAGVPRRLTIWGGTITSITSPVHSGSAAGNSSVGIRVSFKTTGSAVLLAWGGHLAQSSFWNSKGGGERDGASLVSGAPWHVRTLGLDGSGAKNQDRSIQPSAIVGELPPGGPAGPAPTPPSDVVPPLPMGTPPNTTIAMSALDPAPAAWGHALAVIAMVLSALLALNRQSRQRLGAERPAGAEPRYWRGRRHQDASGHDERAT